jgi:hypothetical protein
LGFSHENVVEKSFFNSLLSIYLRAKQIDVDENPAHTKSKLKQQVARKNPQATAQR